MTSHRAMVKGWIWLESWPMRPSSRAVRIHHAPATQTSVSNHGNSRSHQLRAPISP